MYQSLRRPAAHDNGQTCVRQLRKLQTKTEFEFQRLQSLPKQPITGRRQNYRVHVSSHVFIIHNVRHLLNMDVQICILSMYYLLRVIITEIMVLYMHA